MLRLEVVLDGGLAPARRTGGGYRSRRRLSGWAGIPDYIGGSRVELYRHGVLAGDVSTDLGNRRSSPASTVPPSA